MSETTNSTSAPRLLASREVQHRTSLSRATIWRKVRAGEFPRPITLGGNRVAWLETAVNAWILDRVSAGSHA